MKSKRVTNVDLSCIGTQVLDNDIKNLLHFLLPMTNALVTNVASDIIPSQSAYAIHDNICN